MTRNNLAHTDSLARSSRPLPNLDTDYKKQGLKLKEDFEQGKLSLKEYGIRLAVLVADYKAEKGR